MDIEHKKPTWEEERFGGQNPSLPLDKQDRGKPEINESIGSNEIGPPTPFYNNELELKVPDRPSINGLYLGAGMGRAQIYPSFFKLLQENNVRVHLVSGIEMGAIMASLLAFGTTPEKMEWLFFKYFHVSKNLDLFTDKWRDQLIKIFFDDLGEKNIEDAKIQLVIPIKEVDSDKVVFINKGNLKNAIERHLTMISKDPKIGRKLFKIKRLRSYGVDYLVGINLLGGDFYLKDNDTKKINSLKIIDNGFEKNKNKFDNYRRLFLGKLSLDIGKESPGLIENEMSQLNSLLIEMKNYLNKNSTLASEKRLLMESRR